MPSSKQVKAYAYEKKKAEVTINEKKILNNTS